MSGVSKAHCCQRLSIGRTGTVRVDCHCGSGCCNGGTQFVERKVILDRVAVVVGVSTLHRDDALDVTNADRPPDEIATVSRSEHDVGSYQSCTAPRQVNCEGHGKKR